ncbi:MAG: hypothetical protein EXR57_05315 [Dehalococcoidia bacterium]|nr:hypothetical protein [Dehalococcoidia bacterium]
MAITIAAASGGTGIGMVTGTGVAVAGAGDAGRRVAVTSGVGEAVETAGDAGAAVADGGVATGVAAASFGPRHASVRTAPKTAAANKGRLKSLITSTPGRLPCLHSCHGRQFLSRRF